MDQPSCSLTAEPRRKGTKKATKHMAWRRGGGDGVKWIQIVSAREDVPKSSPLETYMYSKWPRIHTLCKTIIYLKSGHALIKIYCSFMKES